MYFFSDFCIIITFPVLERYNHIKCLSVYIRAYSDLDVLTSFYSIDENYFLTIEGCLVCYCVFLS